jgi:hypothetical protein
MYVVYMKCKYVPVVYKSMHVILFGITDIIFINTTYSRSIFLRMSTSFSTTESSNSCSLKLFLRKAVPHSTQAPDPRTNNRSTQFSHLQFKAKIAFKKTPKGLKGSNFHYFHCLVSCFLWNDIRDIITHGKVSNPIVCGGNLHDAWSHLPECVVTTWIPFCKVLDSPVRGQSATCIKRGPSCQSAL